MPEFVAVAKASEVADQSGTCVEVGGKRIALFNRGGQFYAIELVASFTNWPNAL